MGSRGGAFSRPGCSASAVWRCRICSRIRASAAASGDSTGRSVILFWLSGGPGHMETWDPKPDAPRGFRGPFGAIATSVPGVQFGELLPEQARRMDRLAILRTVNHGTGDHTKGNHWMLTGYEGPAFNAPDNKVQRRPSMGSAVARLKGAGRHGMPPYVAVPNLRGGTDNLFHYAAYLGGGANPFVVESDPNDPEVPGQEPDAAEGRLAAPPGGSPPRARGDGRASPRRRSGAPRPRRLLPAGLRDAHRQGGGRCLRHRRRAAAGPRPLRPAHLRPERLAGPAAGRGGHSVRHGQLRPVGPPRDPAPAQDRGGRPRSSSRRSTGRSAH